MKYEVSIDGASSTVELRRSTDDPNRWICHLNGKALQLNAVLVPDGVLSLLFEGKSYEVKRDVSPTAQRIVLEGESFACEVRDSRALRSRKSAAGFSHGPQKITAPMPGKVVRVLAAAGAEVEAGQGIIVIEAMKMQNELKSPKKGVVRKILAAEGAAVNAGDALAVVE